MEIEGSYIQILYLIAVQVMPILCFNFIFIINYTLQAIIAAIFKINADDKYKSLKSIDADLEEFSSVNSSV
jgi:hypothetical protein